MPRSFGKRSKSEIILITLASGRTKLMFIVLFVIKVTKLSAEFASFKERFSMVNSLESQVTKLNVELATLSNKVSVSIN